MMGCRCVIAPDVNPRIPATLHGHVGNRVSFRTQSNLDTYPMHSYIYVITNLTLTHLSPKQAASLGNCRNLPYTQHGTSHDAWSWASYEQFSGRTVLKHPWHAPPVSPHLQNMGHKQQWIPARGWALPILGLLPMLESRSPDPFSLSWTISFAFARRLSNLNLAPASKLGPHRLQRE
jgi:hypothetical protein